MIKRRHAEVRKTAGGRPFGRRTLLRRSITIGKGVAAGLFLGTLGSSRGSAATPVTLRFWASWADMSGARAVVEEVKRRFEQATPGSKIEVSHHDQPSLWLALRTAFQAGQGPDLFFINADVPEFVRGGYTADLATGINWSNVEPVAKKYWTRRSADGRQGTYALTVDLSTNELYYNSALFAKFGITVPANLQFSEDAFADVVQKCVANGKAAFATGVGDRPFPGTYITNYLLLHKLGEDGLQDLWSGGGHVTWTDPRVQEVLIYHRNLVRMKAYPDSITSMKLGEAHLYFYAEQKAAMMPVGSWYTFRAFRPTDSGGQPKDFPLAMLQYPAVKQGRGNDTKFVTNGGSIAVYAKSKNVDRAKEFLNIFTSPDIGALWVSNMGSMSGTKTDISKVKSEHIDYIKTYLDLNKKVKFVDLDWQVTMKPGMRDAYIQVINTAFPAGLISVEEATKILEKARQSGQ